MLWFIYSDYTKTWQLIYNGEHLSYTLDSTAALQFHKKHAASYRTFRIENLYGKVYEFQFPVLSTSTTSSATLTPEQLQSLWYKDITSKRYKNILRLSNLGMVTDYTLGAWKAVCLTYRIWYSETEDFYTLTTAVPTAQSSSYSSLDSATDKPQDAMTQVSWENLERQMSMSYDAESTELPSVGDYINLKEWLMNFQRPDPLEYRASKTAEKQEFKIWEDYYITLPENSKAKNNKWYRKVKIPDNYTAALRYQLFKGALSEWNADPKHRLHQRNTLLQAWQADAKLRMGRKTVIIVPRRWGKTSFLAMEIMGELLNHNYRSATRPRSVLFITKDSDAIIQVMDYINALVKEFDWLKRMMYYEKGSDTLMLRTIDPVTGKRTILSQCKFFSALGRAPAVGQSADAVFFDEAMYIPAGVKDNIMKIVTNEGARLLVVSTFYDEGGGRPLYYRPIELCNKFEQESSQILDPFVHLQELYYKHRFEKNDMTYTLPDECVGLRYTVDDVEVIVDKEGSKAELEDNPEAYMRQLYCRYLEKETVFNYKPALINSVFIPMGQDPQYPAPHYILGEGDVARRYTPDWKRIVTAYDPALSSDMSAWMDSAYDEKRNKIIIFKELQLNLTNKGSFIPQAKLIKEHLDEYLSNFKVPILKSLDSTHPAVVDAMTWQGLNFQYAYRWIWGDAIAATKDAHKPNTWKVPKRLMVEAAQTLFDNNMVEIWGNQCPTLVDQLPKFLEYKNFSNGKSKWMADTSSKTNHDDFVATMLMCLWTRWNHLWLNRNKFQTPDDDPSSSSTPSLQSNIAPAGTIPNPFLTQPTPKTTYTNIDIGFIY